MFNKKMLPGCPGEKVKKVVQPGRQDSGFGLRREFLFLAKPRPFGLITVCGLAACQFT